MKLNVKLFLGFLLGSLMLIFILAFVFYNDLFKILQTQQVSEKQQEMMLRKDSTEHLMRELEGSVVFVSRLSSISQYANTGDQVTKQKIESEFITFLNEHSRYSAVTLIDQNGKELVRAKINGGGTPRLSLPSELKDVSDLYYFDKTRRLNIGEIFVSLHREAGADSSIISHSTPIFNSLGQRKGIIVLEVYADFILEGLTYEHTNEPSAEEEVDTEQKPQITLVNNAGYYLYNPDSSKEWSFVNGVEETLFSDSPQIEALVKTQDSGQVFDENSNSFMIFYRVHPYGENVKEIHIGESNQTISAAEGRIRENDANAYWVQTIAISESQILDKVNILFFKTLSLILLILMLFIVSMMAFLQRIVVEPIEKIMQGADRIKKGNLDYKLILGKRKDEFGDLANEFNSMSAVLKRYKETMEQKIYERTADLEKFKNAIETAAESVIITDPEGMVLYANNATELITGYGKNEIINRNVSSPELWGAITQPQFFDNMWNTIKAEKKSFFGKARKKNKDGTEYTALLNVTPILDKDGNILHFVASESNLDKAL